MGSFHRSGGEIRARIPFIKGLAVSLLRFGIPIPITHGTAMVAALEIASGSSLDGQTVATGIGQTEGATAVAVLRGEEMLIARGPTALRLEA